MHVCKRAVLYLARRKEKAVILFLLFLFVSTLLLIGCSILSGTSQAAKDLRSNIGAAFYIRPYEELKFENGQVSGAGTPVITQKSIEEVIAAVGSELKTYNTEHYGYAKGLSFLPGNGHSEESNMGKVTALRDSSLFGKFVSGEYELTDGRHIKPEDQNKILISSELAMENHLSAGDVIELTHAGLEQKQDGSYIDTIPEKTAFAAVEIVGIFRCNQAADGADTPTAGKAANHILGDSRLLVNLKEQKEGIYEGEAAFYIADPLHLDVTLQKIKDIDSIDWNSHILRENDFQYEKIAGQLQNLQKLAFSLIVTTSVLSAAALMLILIIRIRGRIHEAGIYLSVGRSKIEIIGQFILENGVLLLFGFLPAYLLSVLCCDVLNGMLFGILKQDAGAMGGAKNYLKPDFIRAAALLLGELGAVLLTVLAAGSAVLTLKPKEILTKMS